MTPKVTRIVTLFRPCCKTDTEVLDDYQQFGHCGAVAFDPIKIEERELKAGVAPVLIISIISHRGKFGCCDLLRHGALAVQQTTISASILIDEVWTEGKPFRKPIEFSKEIMEEVAVLTLEVNGVQELPRRYRLKRMFSVDVDQDEMGSGMYNSGCTLLNSILCDPYCSMAPELFMIEAKSDEMIEPRAVAIPAGGG